MNPYKILALLVATLLLCAGSALGAWMVRGWHDDAGQLKQARKDVNTLTTRFDGVITASNTMAATIAQRNRETDANTSQLLAKIGAQNHALTQLQLDIRSIPVGTCQFTPAADGMYQRAYEAAFGATGSHAAATGKTGGRDAAH